MVGSSLEVVISWELVWGFYVWRWGGGCKVLFLAFLGEGWYEMGRMGEVFRFNRKDIVGRLKLNECLRNGPQDCNELICLRLYH